MSVVEPGRTYRISRVVAVDDVYPDEGGDNAHTNHGTYIVRRWDWEEVEPEYEIGAFYIDADGDVFMRRNNDGDDTVHNYPWRGGATSWSEEVPIRPLRKIKP